MSLPKTLPMKTAKGVINVPSVGFGTWAPADTSWCYEATLNALKAGYRHLDCAWKYGVDEAVGKAIRDSGIPRSELFITSKFWPQFGAPENVDKCLDIVLANMGLEYLDLYLAHWPVTFQANDNIGTATARRDATPAEGGEVLDADGKPAVDWAHSSAQMAAAVGQTGSYVPTWQAMQRLVGTGKTRAVGVSNFSITQLREVLGAGGDVPVSCNQVEAHPWFPQTELFAFMAEQGILPTAYSPFAKGRDLLEDPAVVRVAEKNGLGVGQLLQSWAVQRGTIPLGKSQTLERIKANLDVKELFERDMEALDALDKGKAGRQVDLGQKWGVQFYQD